MNAAVPIVPNHTSANRKAVIENSVVRTLAVDDDKTSRRILKVRLEALGYVVEEATNGREAWNILQAKPDAYDVVLLDREMPEMDGMEVIAKMKQLPTLKNLPVIMQTGHDRPEQIREGIDAGVFYYLTKPINGDVLKSVLNAAVREVRQQRLLSSELKQHKISFNLIEHCKFQLRTLSEAEDLACFVANCYPEPERIVSGLAELLVNAVEHGNLGIGYSEKSRLVEEGTWRDEVIRRVKLPEFNNKQVEAVLTREQDGIKIHIRDQGKGFDWRKFMQIDPARAQDNHGRGIAQANAMAFDQLVYNEVGNEVTAFVSNEADLDW